MYGIGPGLILRYFLGIRLDGLRKSTKNFSRDSRFLGRYLIPGTLTYKAVVLTTQQ
jgi:hypothetical protein